MSSSRQSSFDTASKTAYIFRVRINFSRYFLVSTLSILVFYSLSANSKSAYSAIDYISPSQPLEASVESIKNGDGLATDIVTNNFDPFFGQNHAYSVTFRGNGQAIVFLKVTFSNNSEEKLNELTLRLPKVDAEGIATYQIIKEKQCVRYDYTKPAVPPNYQYPCQQYDEPNYFYHYGNNTYKKAKATLTTDSLKIDLPQPLEPQKSGMVLVYFRAFGFAQKDAFGAYNYKFETLRVDDTIVNLQVGISPDSDLYMKGAKGNVDYFRESAPMIESSRAMDVGTSFKSASIDNSMNNIGYGSINKTAKNLMPLDTYKVEGAYADSMVKLYAKPVVTLIMVVLVMLFVGLIVLRRLVKSLNKKTGNPETGTKSSQNGTNVGLAVGVGFMSATTISLLVFLAYFLTKMTRSFYSYSYGGEASSVLVVFMVMLLVALIGLFLVFPSIVVGVKRGIWWGLLTFVATLMWLFVAFIIMGIFLLGFRTTDGNYPIRPMLSM